MIPLVISIDFAAHFKVLFNMVHSKNNKCIFVIIHLLFFECTIYAISIAKKTASKATHSPGL